METEKTNFRQPQESQLAFVGTRIYNLCGEKYKTSYSQRFFPEELTQLEKFLKDFEGIIVGHNILKFDYEVLRKHFSDGIPIALVEKTIDTQFFLYLRNNSSLHGLSLDHLAQANFGVSKTIHGKYLPELWRGGQREKVFQHNEEDLELTFKLWWQLVKKREVLTGGAKHKIELTDEDVARLIGEKPLVR